MINKEKEIHNLEYLLSECQKTYDLGQIPIDPFTGLPVTDNNFDAHTRAYKKLTGKDFDFKSVSQSIAKPIKHEIPMASIDKCSGNISEKDNTLHKFIKDCKATRVNSIAPDFIVMSYKLDGCALSLKYKNGKLQSAALRGDGITGEDITHLAKYVPSIPNTLPKNVTCTIRGEVVCLKSDFAELQKQLAKCHGARVPKNARNYVAGALKKSFSYASEVEARRLSFIAYDYIHRYDAFTTYSEKLHYLRSALNLKTLNVVNYAYSEILSMEKEAPKKKMLLDGIVITCNYIKNRQIMGHHGSDIEKNPKFSTAWKFVDEVAQTTIQKIEWSVGRTGELYPVLIVTPIELEGTTVSRCTGHNAGYVAEHGLQKGVIIEIIKSGKIIPKVHKVISKVRTPLILPRICPECKHKVILEFENKFSCVVTHLRCTNKKCAAIACETIEHFLKTLGVKGIGPAIIKKLYSHKKIESVNDLYLLQSYNIMDADFTRKESYNILSSLYMLKENDVIVSTKVSMAIKQAKVSPYLDKTKKIKMRWYKLFAALGINGCGRSLSKILEREYPMKGESIFNCSRLELENIEGVGTKTAENIVNYLAHNIVEVKWLATTVFQTTCPTPPKNTNNDVSGKTFCFTGGFASGKKFWEAEVEKMGGIVKKSFSKKLDYMVVGDKAGSKKQKAFDAGIDILDVIEITQLLKHIS